MQYDFNLTSGQTQVLDVSGRFFKYKSGTGLIRVRTSKGGYVDLLPGQGVWGVDFTTLVIKDKSGAANVGVILAGAYDFHDDRIVGNVEVVDGGRARTNLNIAFLASPGKIAVAGQYSYASLWNPPGSGKALVVESVYVSSTVAGALVLRPQSATIGASGVAPSSKKIGGGGSSVGVTYNGSLVANVDNSIHGVTNTANGSFKFEFVEPLVILPGYGLGAAGTVNQDVSAVFEFFEDPV